MHVTHNFRWKRLSCPGLGINHFADYEIQRVRVPNSRLTGKVLECNSIVGEAPAVLKQRSYRSAFTYLTLDCLLVSRLTNTTACFPHHRSYQFATAFIKRQLKIQRSLFFRDISGGMICTAKWMGPSCNHLITYRNRYWCHHRNPISIPFCKWDTG